MSTLVDLSGATAAAVAEAATRVVRVSGPGMPAVSGLIWSQGLVITAEEALDGGEGLKVETADGASQGAELVGRDPSTDVALLRVSAGPDGAWGRAPIPVVGSLVLIVGRGEYSPTAGIAMVAETGPAWQSMHGGRIEARIRLGIALSGQTEGAAVVAPDGQLIGMAVTGPQRRTLVIPAANLAAAVETLSAHGYVARGYLGVSLQPLNWHDSQRGAIVTAVEAESPAARAGLLVGDIITTWDGTEIANAGDLARQLGTGSVGNVARLGLTRGGNPMGIEVTIGERRLGQ